MNTLNIKEGYFTAQLVRPSFREALDGFKWNFWDVRDEESDDTTIQYKQRRLYVKSVTGRFSDDLGYIDLLTGEIVASKPRFASKLDTFVEIVENGYQEFRADNPSFHGEGEKGTSTLPVALLNEIKNVPQGKTIGLRAHYGNEYHVEVFEVLAKSNTYELFFYRNGVFKTKKHVNGYYGFVKLDTPVIDQLNAVLSFYQPDAGKWQVVEVEDIKTLIYPRNADWNNFNNRTIVS